MNEGKGEEGKGKEEPLNKSLATTLVATMHGFRCEYQTTCDVAPTDDVYGNPCPPHIVKYLEVNYRCEPRK